MRVSLLGADASISMRPQRLTDTSDRHCGHSSYLDFRAASYRRSADCVLVKKLCQLLGMLMSLSIKHILASFGTRSKFQDHPAIV